MISIAVIGTGYVGLVTAVCFAEKDFKVICVDKDKCKIDNLSNGIMPIYENGLKEMCESNYQRKKIFFTTDIKYAIENTDVIFIAVGTPSLNSGEADLSQVIEVANEIKEYINNYKVIVNKSTVPVGTQKIVKSIMKTNKNNINFDVVSNPEFLKEGTAINDTLNAERIVIGCDSYKSEEYMRRIYERFDSEKLVVSAETAEMIKYASNVFLALKVTYINEIANICELTGANVIDVAKGMGLDSRISGKFLNAGVGFGGACFPKDVLAIYSLAKSVGYEFKLSKAVLEVNEKQKLKPYEKLMEVMNNNLKGKTIAVLGLAFKPGTDDMRGAPSIIIINKLLEKGAKVKAYDPEAIKNAKKIFGSRIGFYTEVYETIKYADAIIILTEWNEIKFMNLEEALTLVKNKLIIDGRNCIDSVNAMKLGYYYLGIGVPDSSYDNILSKEVAVDYD